jgi:hypothetical protein
MFGCGDPGKDRALYYTWHAAKQLTLSLDYQYVVNPTYNAGRGPVRIIGRTPASGI